MPICSRYDPETKTWADYEMPSIGAESTKERQLVPIESAQLHPQFSFLYRAEHDQLLEFAQARYPNCCSEHIKLNNDIYHAANDQEHKTTWLDCAKQLAVSLELIPTIMLVCIIVLVIISVWLTEALI